MHQRVIILLQMHVSTPRQVSGLIPHCFFKLHAKRKNMPICVDIGRWIQDQSQTSQYTIKYNHYVQSWAINNQKVQPDPPQTQYADD